MKKHAVPAIGLVLAVVLAVFAGAAYAGNGNGNGNQGDKPGNSAGAPGQQKKDEAPTPAPQTTTAAPPVTTTDANATGVKPANDTAHDTHAQAQSDKTKQYGNGQTAGQIAEKNGAAGKAVLHGPGNSQPHKIAPCSGGHEVDVHALKSHHGDSCGGPAPSPTPQPHPQPHLGPPMAPPTTTTTTEEKPSKDPGSKPAAGDASGASASSGRQEGQSEGVLASATSGTTLPFTGFPLWIAVLAAIAATGIGLALRHQAREID